MGTCRVDSCACVLLDDASHHVLKWFVHPAQRPDAGIDDGAAVALDLVWLVLEIGVRRFL